ncbi:MAG: Asp-tRNA(Asn)/Glu-tRNA(Gln) amidotransferase subunit GatC [Peptococcaceae bacterium]|nr:Asp-tRNA(Asn)/Glu-tRNA(Gln) amidotransferase subunit GatC [Peptococcaceae bacterium]
MNDETLNTLANLNKLRLSPEENLALCEDFTLLLSALEPLANAETSQVEPMIQINSLGTVMRADTVVPMVHRDEILANAPEQDQGCFVAPKVLE